MIGVQAGATLRTLPSTAGPRCSSWRCTTSAAISSVLPPLRGSAMPIRFFERNTRGRDFAVGDIHACVSALLRALIEISFDPAVDRLFSVGDLVDRGREPERVFELLGRPWFHAVR